LNNETNELQVKPMPTTSPRKSHPLGLVLAVAPQALARGRFAAKGKASPAISPAAALAWLDERLALGEAIDTVEIAGPGDPLATPGLTVETLDLVRKKYPRLDLVVTTLGIHGDQKIKTLVEHGLSRLILEVDAATPKVVQRLYAWIRPANKTIPLAQAAEILLSEQQACLAACTQAGLPVSIRTTVYPGVNDDHIEEIAYQVASLGATAMIILPALPTTDGEVSIPAPSQELIHTLRTLAGQHLPILDAPAASGPGVPPAPAPATLLPRPTHERPNVAVVSASGMAVDLHLGQATRVLVYGPREDGLVSLLDTRPMPAAGGGTSRWEQLAALLPDCFAVLAGSAGANPQAVLQGHGIPVLITDGEIEGTVDHLYGGGKKSKRRDKRL
jgi:nitrogen fixation protein NifB